MRPVQLPGPPWPPCAASLWPTLALLGLAVQQVLRHLAPKSRPKMLMLKQVLRQVAATAEDADDAWPCQGVA